MTNVQTLQSAREIAEHCLEISGRALRTRDFGLIATVFHLPQIMSVPGARVTVLNHQQFERIFFEMCSHFDSIGLTDLVRRCEAAEFRGPDRIEATHISHLISGTKHLQAPYPVFNVIERIDGQWRVTESDYAFDENGGQARAITDNGVKLDAAKALYQNHLDVMADALMAQDFKGFRRCISLPHRLTTESDMIETTTEAEMQAMMHKFAALYQGYGLTDFVRNVTSARFVGPTEIVGTHDSHLMRDGKRLVPPYPNRLRLVRSPDGLWRETHSANALQNTGENFNSWPRVANDPRLPDLALDPERTPK